METRETLTVPQLIDRLNSMGLREKRKLLKQLLPRYQHFPEEGLRIIEQLESAGVLDPQEVYEARSRLNKWANGSRA